MICNFKKSGCRKIRMLKYLNFAVAQADLRFPLQRKGTVFVK